MKRILRRLFQPLVDTSAPADQRQSSLAGADPKRQVDVEPAGQSDRELVADVERQLNSLTMICKDWFEDPHFSQTEFERSVITVRSFLYGLVDLLWSKNTDRDKKLWHAAISALREVEHDVQLTWSSVSACRHLNLPIAGATKEACLKELPQLRTPTIAVRLGTDLHRKDSRTLEPDP